MSPQISELSEKIASTAVVNRQLIDNLLELSTLQMEHSLADSLATAQRAATEANTMRYDEGEAAAAFQAGNCAAQLRDYHKARGYYRRAVQLFNRLKLPEKESAALAKLGNANLHDSKFADALLCYEAAIDIREKLNDLSGAADQYTNSGIIHGFQGNYAQALQLHLKAQKIYEELHLSSRLASSATNVGVIYLEQNNYEEALKVFKTALVIREQEQNNAEVSKLLNNMGNVYHAMGNYTEAITTHHRALEINRQIGDDVRIATSFTNMGNSYRATGQLETALKNYNEAKHLFTKAKDKRGLVQSYLNLGELSEQLQRKEEAHAHFAKAMVLAEETGLKNQLANALEFSARLHAADGNFAEAYQLQTNFMKLEKELNNTETKRLMAQMTVRHEMEQKEREAQLEKQKNEELTKAYHALDTEKKRSDDLLLNILPFEISEELKTYGKTSPRSYAATSVMFADIKGFTIISEQLTAEEIVSGIDEYFEAFDLIMEKHGIEKIKTIGDAYLCVSGIPLPDEQHATKMVRAAKDMQQVLLQLKHKREAAGKPGFAFRIGIHSGPLVAGVVGIKKFAYDIWGDSVNTAARMEQNSEAWKINVSESTYQLVKDEFNCIYRGEISAKNKGALKMYFVE